MGSALSYEGQTGRPDTQPPDWEPVRTVRAPVMAAIAIIVMIGSVAGLAATGGGAGSGNRDGNERAASDTADRTTPQPDSAAAAIRDRLDALQAAIDAVSEERDDLDRDLSDTIAELGRTIRDANDAATALDVLSTRRDDTEARIEAFTVRETALRRDLRTHTRSIEHLTSPMLAAARAPLAPSVTAASDPLAAARSTIVARRVMTDIDGEIAALRTEIDDLTRLGAMLQAEWANLAEDSRAEAERLADLESAAEEKRTVVAALVDARETQTGRLESLAGLTVSLENTIDTLETEARRLRDARDRRAIISPADGRSGVAAAPRYGGAEDPRSPFDPLDTRWPEVTEIDRAEQTPQDNPESAEILSTFAEAGIRPPSTGQVVAAFGEPDSFGDPLPGMRFTVDPGTPVVAPLGGTVKFAGSFGGYGRLLILEHSEGYHSLIAGFAEITVDPGQAVTRGAMLGRAPSPQNGQTQRPEIYFEVRQDGRPVAPLEGLSRAQERGRG